MLENLPVRTQLIVLSAILLILFFLVRYNTRRNRQKRLKKRDFGERVSANRRQKQKEEKDLN